MIRLKLYPDETVHRKTPDGAYFQFGVGTKAAAQVIVVGPREGAIADYAQAAAHLADWPGYKIRSAEAMPPENPAYRDEVTARGFLSIILDRP